EPVEAIADVLNPVRHGRLDVARRARRPYARPPATARGRRATSSGRRGRSGPAFAAAAPIPVIAEHLSPLLRRAQREIEDRLRVRVVPGRISRRKLSLQDPRRPMREELAVMRLVIHGHDLLAL